MIWMETAEVSLERKSNGNESESEGEGEGEGEAWEAAERRID